MKKYRVVVTRKSVEELTVYVTADSLVHAHSVVNEWVFNPQPEDISFYDSCTSSVVTDTDEEITSIKLAN
jgi:hypothetical protein